MLLDSLKICAFRGILNELPLDLRARLTLIHAPNGVGKTSLCDAVEWLFTGEVERLREPLGRTKGKGVNNIFTSALPLIEAEIRNGRSSHIRRAGKAKPNEIEVFEGGNWKKIPLNTLLSEITPENLPQSSKGLQQLNNRRSWFRAVRLLEAHALNLLLDTDDPSNDVRDLVFCDLLGVGELQRQERDLRKIVAAIGGKARLREDSEEVRREIKSRESEINSDALQASAPNLETFQQLLTSVWERLGQQQPAKPGSAESNIVAAENSLALAARKLRQQRSALSYVKTKASDYLMSVKNISELETQREALNLRRTDTEKDLQTSTNLFQRLQNEISSAEALERSLFSQPLDSVRITLEGALAEWKQAVEDEKTRIDLTRLENALTKANASHKQSNKLLKTVSKCEQSLKAWQEARKREAALSETIRNIILPTIEDRTKLEDSLSNMRLKLVTIETQFDQLTGPLEQLRIAGQQFLKGAKEEHRCPLCAYDHGDPIVLHNAIEMGISSIPEALKTLSQRKQALEGEILVSEQQQEIWNKTSDTLKSLTTQREDTRRTLTEATPTLETLGFNMNDLLDDALPSRIAELRSKIDEQVVQAERTVAARSRVFHVALALQSVAREIGTLAANIQAFTDVEPIGDLELIPPAEWPRVLGLLTKSAENRAAQARSEAATVRKSASEAAAALAGLRSNLEMLAASIEEISEKINSAKTEKDNFETQWHLVADQRPWSRELLEEQETILYETEENLATAKQEIDSARGALLAARESESKERDRAGRQQQLVQLNARLSELEAIEEVRNQCVIGAESLRSAKDAFVKEQIQPLCDVITALYVRAQSTTFIDRIDSSQDAGPLRWLACIGERQLEDTAQMSLGQRQDLALAIFLSRARELGGTFFLDEPLLNLDDLNRLAVLDVLRTIVIEQRSRPVRLVVTTANQSLVRHCKEKFALVKGKDSEPAFRAYRLFGDPQTGVSAVVEH